MKDMELDSKAWLDTSTSTVMPVPFSTSVSKPPGRRWPWKQGKVSVDSSAEASRMASRIVRELGELLQHIPYVKGIAGLTNELLTIREAFTLIYIRQRKLT